MTFGEVHRSWIQTCASQGCIPYDDALRLFELLWQKGEHHIRYYCSSQSLASLPPTTEHDRQSNENDLDEIHDEINEKLQAMSQKISVETCFVTHKKYVVFADTSDAEIMK